MAKEFLLQNNIPYTEKNIQEDPEAATELRNRNITGVPAFFIGDEIVVGLDREKILNLTKSQESEQRH